MRGGQTPDRGQSGLDRLGLFLLVVFLVVLVAPTVLGFVGVDVREDDEGSDREPSLRMLGVEGFAIDESRDSVGAVRIILTNTGSGTIDPAELSATWVDNGSYALVAASADSEDADGTFSVRPFDESRESALLREHGDRAVLTFDLGTDDVEGAREFGDRLEAGETATVTLVSPEGASARIVIPVPDTLPGEGTVAL